ncbi:MAG TPA: iron-sulfur cluster assembly scaffold protein [Candidatus Cloacimonas acidaminovorans]|jgi:nitrogen fixation NifU-like protein|nr:iron-sulfur cluster assembly scaffold protein [Candidatus Cloacimonas sp.]HOE55277.1 iron-sulfur cluster assembly scaffold protein [Candidatus Cloacimonas acidaminovorans]HOM78911.1 iron-sulfur cluster assembly scaffold protein [Candidatus Cloacimonas acidaminovorans]HOS07416.1 iron-sulfur cluster assembly scaffold protein [Candidatus Cloacimonas acidaminovorans]HOT39379.1 iron-sulfur cluster assembly scaffold protein [Candidatus Cloacimonas acidaminovorans]
MQYSQKVLDHFMHPHNVGKMENPDAVATEGSPACGDQVTVYLKVDDKTKTITDISFLSYGCASNIATASIITDMAKGKTLEEAKKITWRDAMDALDGLPPVKVHCSVLAADTLQSAISNYEIAHGLKEVPNFGKATIEEELRKIIYPQIGEDIISLKMVKYIGFQDGEVTIDMNIMKFDQWRDNIAEEIREHLQKYPEVKKITINFP